MLNQREEFLKKVSKELLIVPVSVYDVATIDNILKSILEHENIKEIKVYDSTKLLLSKIAKQNNEINSEKFTVPLILDNIQIGSLELWFDFSEDYEIINQHKDRLFIIIFLEFLISLFLAIIIASSISRNLKKLKNEVEKNKQKDKVLFQQSKLASMGEMIGNIAHQWRQPLSVISSSATGLIVQSQNKVLTAQTLEVNCKYINDNVQYLSKTIDDFREYIRGENNKSYFKVSSLKESFLKLAEPILRNEDINLVIDLKDNIELFSYPNEFLQVILNIVNNSKDAFKNQDVVDKFIFIDFYKEEDNYIIEIKDNALGVDEEIVEKIYEPYFTTKHKNVGTGLGLTIVYNLVVNGIGGKVTSENCNFTYERHKFKGLRTKIVLSIEQ